MTLALSASRLRRVLLALAFVLVLASLASVLTARSAGLGMGGLVRILNVDAEKSVPTWYAALGLAASCALLALSAAQARTSGRGFVAHWATLAAVFGLLSSDEIVGFHEAMGKALQRHVDFHGYLRYAWVLPAFPALAVLALSYRRFLSALLPRTRASFLLSGALFVAGAVGLEMVGGKLDETLSRDSTLYVLCYHVEELLELTGIALFNAALLEHLAGVLGPEGLRVRVSAD